MRSTRTYGVLLETTGRITSVSNGWAGQRQQPGLLLREDLRDGLIARLGMRALMGDLIPPPAKLRVEVVDIAKGPGSKEGFFTVLSTATKCLVAHGLRPSAIRRPSRKPSEPA